MSQARLLQLALGAVLILACAWLLAWHASGHTAIAIAGSLMIAFIHAPLLALELVLARWQNRLDPVPAPSIGELARAWGHETVCAMRVFGWQQPFASNRFPDRLPDRATTRIETNHARRGVILVHGFMCNRGVWNSWRRRLNQHHTPTIALNLHPAFASIDSYAGQIDAAVVSMTQHTGQRPVLVAHSMGGLAVRAWLRAFASHERVHHVVTVASPHQGTWLARFGHGVNAREMRHRSPWFDPLANAESTLPAAKFTCYYSHCDNIVFPCSSATLRHADNRHVRARAHVHLLYHPSIVEEVLRLVRE